MKKNADRTRKTRYEREPSSAGSFNGRANRLTEHSVKSAGTLPRPVCQPSLAPTLPTPLDLRRLAPRAGCGRGDAAMGAPPPPVSTGRARAGRDSNAVREAVELVTLRVAPLAARTSSRSSARRRSGLGSAQRAGRLRRGLLWTPIRPGEGIASRLEPTPVS